MIHDDRRLIEDYLPIQAISAEASRENPSARDTSPHSICGGRDDRSSRVGRRCMAHLCQCRSFCRMGGLTRRRKVWGARMQPSSLNGYASIPARRMSSRKRRSTFSKRTRNGLSRETGKPVTVEDIVAGRAPRPKVLDMFAGGGAIPLEALRLGCESYALDLNPVAHIIQLCTLVYPQKFGKPDPNADRLGKDGPWADSRRKSSIGAIGCWKK